LPDTPRSLSSAPRRLIFLSNTTGGKQYS
jgi:hypothetical protein